MHAGFLAGPEVKEKGALNAGLRASQCLLLQPAELKIYHLAVDQNLALQWVQEHVSGFLTIFTLPLIA